MSNIVMCAACKNSSIVDVREPCVELQARSCTKVKLSHHHKCVNAVTHAISKVTKA